MNRNLSNCENSPKKKKKKPRKTFFSDYFRNCLNCDSLQWSHTHFNVMEVSNDAIIPINHLNYEDNQISSYLMIMFLKKIRDKLLIILSKAGIKIVLSFI